METFTTNLPVLPAQIQKKAEQIFKKYEHSAAKRLRKSEVQNPRHPFFTHHFSGKKIVSFFLHRYLRAAEAAFAREDWAETEKKLRLAMRWNPQNAEVWFLTARLNVQNASDQNVIGSASCVLHLKPDFLRARILRARTEMKNRRLFPAAILDWYRVLEVSPGFVEAWEQLGTIFSELEEYSSAGVYLSRAVELEPGNFALTMKLVENLLFQKKYEAVEDLSTRLTKQFMEVLSAEFHEPVETPEQRKALLEKKVAGTRDYNLGVFYLEILFKRIFALDILERFDEEEEICKEILLYEEMEFVSPLPEESFHRARHHITMNFARTNLVDIYFQKQQWESALPVCLEQIRKAGESQELVHKVLVCMDQLGKKEEILEFCSELIAKGTQCDEVYHARAISRLLNGRLDEGVVDLQEAVRLAPRQAEYWYNLSKVLLLLNRLPEAAEAGERALALRPGMLEAGLTFVRILDLLGRSEEANRAIEKLMKNVPLYIDSLILKGDLLCRRKDFQGAKKVYDEALKLAGNHPIALIGRSRVWEEEENWQNAYDDVSAAIRVAPGISGIFLHRAMYAVNLKNFQQAQSDLRCYMEQNPEDLRATLLLGEIRLGLKQPEAALVLFQKVLARDSRCVPALLRSAEAKSSLLLYEPALADIEQALEAEGGNSELKVLKIQLLLKLNREKDALDYCTASLAEDPENISIHYNRGAILLNSQRPEDALPDFEFVCGREPDSVQPQYARALALNALYRHEEAMEALNLVLKIQPDFVPALSEKAMIHSILGDPKQSLKLLKKVLEKNPEDVLLLNIFGTVLANEQRIDEAVVAFQKAVDIQPDYAPALNNLGHMQMLLGNLDQGLQSLSSAISSNPQWGRPYLNRALVYMRMYELEEAENDISEARRKAQKAGDEDLLVDAIELRKKLNILKKFLTPDDEDSIPGFDPDDPDDSDDSDDSDNLFEPPGEFDPDEPFTWGDMTPEELESFKNIFGKHGENDFLFPEIDDSDEDSSILNEFTTDDSKTDDSEWDDSEWDEKSASEEDSVEENDSEDENFSISSFWDSHDWKKDEDEPETDEDEDEIWAEDEDEDEDEEEDPEDFDFLVDGEDALTNLTSDFMQIEEFFTDGVPTNSQDVGKNLWPKFERVAKTPADSGNASGKDSQFGSSVEMLLNYADFSNEVTNPDRKKVTPTQIQQATNFFTMLFQLWKPERLKPIEGREDFDGESIMIPPIIINCPQFFHQLPENAPGMTLEGTAPGNGFGFDLPTSNYIRYQKDRAFFFEQLTAISELLNRELANAKEPQEEKLAKKHKRDFHFLTQMIMKALINKENELLLVITNFLTEEIMNSLGRE